MAIVGQGEVIPTPTAALFALDVEHVELAHDVAEYDRAVSRGRGGGIWRGAQDLLRSRRWAC
jgi:hypothetical protein